MRGFITHFRSGAMIGLCASVIGCMPVHTDDGNMRFDPYGPLNPHRKELIAGKYAAYFFGNNIVVVASGVRPYTGWKIELEQEGRENGKPVLALYGEDPGVGGAMMTPFLVSCVLRPASPGPKLSPADKFVVVRDVKRVHDVAVELLPVDFLVPWRTAWQLRLLTLGRKSFGLRRAMVRK
jgi:hypothetical protein